MRITTAAERLWFEDQDMTEHRLRLQFPVANPGCTPSRISHHLPWRRRRIPNPPEMSCGDNPGSDDKDYDNVQIAEPLAHDGDERCQ
ncbi:MAG: hypothetical protein HY912_14760 [Desulfomonile tiedjei]|uniref:Uncharacterized protein n=1 Tax=Desulfomonile tiedjei TaxID=2358 RepID=A0A9D6V4M8_9BACT|nr:hypothetical protein [Desulfomonile tiedjei]